MFISTDLEKSQKLMEVFISNFGTIQLKKSISPICTLTAPLLIFLVSISPKIIKIEKERETETSSISRFVKNSPETLIIQYLNSGYIFELQI